MNEEQIRQIIKEELANLIKIDKYVFNKNIQIMDGRNIQVGRTTGTIIGTETDQKIGIYGNTPVIQAGAITKPTGGSNIDPQARTAIDDLIDKIKAFGITA